MRSRQELMVLLIAAVSFLEEISLISWLTRVWLKGKYWQNTLMQLFRSFLQVGWSDNGYAWTIHLHLVHYYFYPKVSDLWEGHSKVRRWDYQPSRKSPFLIDFLVEFNEKFWRRYQSCCEKLSQRLFFMNWQIHLHFSINPSDSSKRATTFGQRARYSSSKRWSETHRLWS